MERDKKMYWLLKLDDDLTKKLKFDLQNKNEFKTIELGVCVYLPEKNQILFDYRCSSEESLLNIKYKNNPRIGRAYIFIASIFDDDGDDYMIGHMPIHNFNLDEITQITNSEGMQIKIEGIHRNLTRNKFYIGRTKNIVSSYSGADRKSPFGGGPLSVFKEPDKLLEYLNENYDL
jgi:hypothetical protein